MFSRKKEPKHWLRAKLHRDQGGLQRENSLQHQSEDRECCIPASGMSTGSLIHLEERSGRARDMRNDSKTGIY